MGAEQLMRLSPKNWASFQHYKDRAPAWIKLHKALLDDYEFQSLPVASRALAPMLWLLASEQQDGTIEASTAKLAFRLRMTEKEFDDAVKPLIDHGFFEDASGALAECKHDDSLEKEKRREEKETRERVALGEEFWKVYPHPKNPGSKQKVLDGINKLPPDEQKAALASIPKLLDAIADQRKKIRDYQAPMAQTYVNQRRWEGFEIVSRETSAPVVLPEEAEARGVAERVVRAIGPPAYASWFTHQGRALIEKNCSGFILRQVNSMQADKWKNDYRGMLDDVVGKGNWRVESTPTA